MDSYDGLLRKIRENPEVYLQEKKSLKLLWAYLSGYRFGRKREIWESNTGLDYFEEFDEERYKDLERAKKGGMSLYDPPIEFMEFIYFVHTHYDKMITLGGTTMPATTMAATTLIEKMTNSDEEAFDTFFELFEAFHVQKGILGEDFIKHYDKTL